MWIAVVFPLLKLEDARRGAAPEIRFRDSGCPVKLQWTTKSTRDIHKVHKEKFTL